jgi:hypothetical protein
MVLRSMAARLEEHLVGSVVLGEGELGVEVSLEHLVL